MVLRKKLLAAAKARRAQKGALGRQNSTNPTQSPEPDPARPGADIVALRKKLGMTQERLADYIGVTKIAVQNWEAGRRVPAPPTMLLLYYIARFGMIRVK